MQPAVELRSESSLSVLALANCAKKQLFHGHIETVWK